LQCRAHDRHRQTEHIQILYCAAGRIHVAGVRDCRRS
jgi:hypothetical protein